MINISVKPELNNNEVDVPLMYRYDPKVARLVAISAFGPP